ncbi:MAG TPA: hypothetical protein VM717_11785 [Chthoniobacterales bacterium]|jgi:hypothetical protein|nr:hypothetical protein [Chthoniobacterales bacterium]
MKIQTLVIVALTCGLSGLCFAQGSPATSTTTIKATGSSSAPYNEGAVWTLSMIKTKAGLADEYFKQITSTVKPVYEEAKKQRIILDYKILNGEASDSHDFNILILVEFPNMAAFDTLREKMDPIAEKAMGSAEQRKDMAVKRLDIREILGTKTMREITLK